ncbi:hypothetical protein [Staphylococcus marylandisciuri]|nr:hypothetical protein [Staphylococcus marylandisciuri]
MRQAKDETSLLVVSKLGRGPNREKLSNQFLQAMRVGVAPTQRN